MEATALRSTLNTLVSELDVETVQLSERCLKQGWALDFRASAMPGLCYVLSGTGQLAVAGRTIEIAPHTLVIMPRETPYRLHAPGSSCATNQRRILDAATPGQSNGKATSCASGEKAELHLLSGQFRSSCGAMQDIFSGLHAPIVEHFAAGEGLKDKLLAAFEELAGGEIGAEAMSRALLKQIIIMLVRRAAALNGDWLDRFSLLGDERIKRAMAEMAADPAKAHTVEELARHAGLSRSSFMSRFTACVGEAPMQALRNLRMRQAAKLLEQNISVEQASRQVGYQNRASFHRAFRRAYGCDPSTYRATFLDRIGQT